MRTLFVGLAATAALASSAAAANFDVNAADATLDDISSGTSDVVDCTEGLETDLVPAKYVPAVNDWDLASVTVAAAAVGDDVSTIGERCAGFVVTVVVESNIDDQRVENAVENTDSVVLESLIVEADTTTLTFPATEAIRVSEIDEVSILVDRPNTFDVNR